MQAVKKGAEAHGIGRSKGGLTRKIHASVDALGLPIRFVIPPGQRGDCPQARGLIKGLPGVRHVTADAAYDADHLRGFIADDLGATPQIKQNPTRSTKQPIDWMLYKESALNNHQYLEFIGQHDDFVGRLVQGLLESELEPCNFER